jgi:CBS domain-containing protein
MSLATRRRTLHTENGTEQQLVVACPQRIDPVSIEECARCELCAGLELDGHVSVRCTVEPPEAEAGAPGAHAAVTTIMTAPVVSVERDASIENVQWLLVERGIGAVPVVDRSGRPIGIVAKTDLLRDRDEPTTSVNLASRAALEAGSSERQTSGLRAGDLMTPVVHAVLRHTSIAATAAVMARERVHHVVVVTDDGSIAGIVSTFDLARWVAARERFVPRTAPLGVKSGPAT